jgi:hypothetical protein
MKAILIALTAYWLLGVASCQPKTEDDSELALVAGNATLVLGGCQRPWAMGYEVCQLQQGDKLPSLQMGFMNPGEWAVSDCSGNLFKTGATDKPGVVEVDLSALQMALDRRRVCWLKVEAKEYFQDPKDTSQRRTLALAGGFIVELLAPGYMPIPSEDFTAWCYEIRRTTKGRTSVGKCK